MRMTPRLSSILVAWVVIAKVATAFNLTFEDGSTYLGDTDADNAPNGFGKLLFENGDIYE